jgi:hypothetical protein
MLLKIFKKVVRTAIQDAAFVASLLTTVEVVIVQGFKNIGKFE